MTLRDWLHERTPPAPARLSARIEDALGDRLTSDAASAPDACVDAAELLLRDLLEHSATGRESALDLLTVDALITYAFEAAATDPATLESRATAAMSRLSHLAG